MSDNWIVQNLNSALSTWSEKMAELWTLLTENPATFKGGGRHLADYDKYQ